MAKTMSNDKRFSENEPNNNNNVCTYNTYIHTLLSQRKKERKAHSTISISPTVWHEFQTQVKLTDPFSNASQKLEDFMVDFIVHAVQDRGQPKITQFFIKANQVNIAEKQVVVKRERKRPDYSKMDLEELERQYRLARTRRDSTTIQLIAFEFKKRGIS